MAGARFLQLLGGLTVVAAGWAVAAQEEGGKLQVGDWVTLKFSGKGLPPVTITKTIIARDAATVTLKFEQSIGAKKLPAKENTVKISELRKPAKIASHLTKAKIEKLNTGKANLEVKGKKLACEWVEYKVSYDDNGKAIPSQSKLWLAPAIPVDGLVKMENEVAGNKTTMQLVDFGWGK